MSNLKKKIKVTRDPVLFVGKDTQGKWRIEKGNGKLDPQILLSEWEAKETAITIASIENAKNKNWRQYKEKHSEILRSYMMVLVS